MANLVTWTFIVIVLFGTILYLTRTVLILAGWLKSPILRLFEKYGDEEPFYYPLPGLLIAAAVVAFFGGAWLAPVLRIWCLPAGPGLVLLFAAYVAQAQIEEARRYPGIFMHYPHWLRLLREDTTREERRRIAYRWHHLPFRTRLLLNSSDRAFFQWADFVVMATLN